MAMKNHEPALPLLIFIIAILASACGGDAGPTQDGGGNNPPFSGDLNPGLPGKLFFKEKTERSDGSKIDEAWTMDIATGKYTKIHNTNWADHKDRFPGNLDDISVASVDYDATNFVVAIEGCKNDPEYTCIAMQEMGGNYISQFDLLGDIRSTRMSRDRQHIALFNREGTTTSSDFWLEIYNQNGILLSSSKLEDNFVFELEWLPDGRIVYSIRRTLYFTAPYSAQVRAPKLYPTIYQEKR